MGEQKNFLARLLEGIKGTGNGWIGATIGFVLGLLIFTFGFLKTLVIIVLTFAGYYFSVRYFSNPDDFRNLLDKLFPPGFFR